MIVRDRTGTVVNFTEHDYLKAIAILNQNFNQFQIFFKYRGFLVNSPDQIPNMLNLVLNDNVNAGQYLTLGEIQVGYTSLTNPEHEWVLIHEVGHALGLCHTYEGTTTPPSPNYPYTNPPFCNGTPVIKGFKPTNFGSKHEHVARSGPHYNALTHGDFIHDTPATFSYQNVCYDSSDPQNSTFLYSNEITDSVGTPYVSPDLFNFMNNGQYFDILGQFTNGQGVRMRETSLNNPLHLACQEEDVSALYEPYKGEYYFAGPLPLVGPTFQPGFDYRFVECDCLCNEPRPYGNTNFTYNNTNILASFDTDETNYDAIVHPNHSAIRILQLEDGSSGGTQPWCCYDNMNFAPGGGTVTRFNDGVFNTNVTITSKDSLGINDPNLIYDLTPGLYVIDKDYHDGSQAQQTVIKNE